MSILTTKLSVKKLRPRKYFRGRLNLPLNNLFGQTTEL